MLMATALSFATFIAYLSLAPGDSRVVRWIPSWLHSVGHFGCYAILGFLLAIALVLIIPSALLRGFAAFGVATAFGGLMEYLQQGRAGRTSSFTDAVTNAVGALAGVITAVAM